MAAEFTVVVSHESYDFLVGFRDELHKAVNLFVFDSPDPVIDDDLDLYFGPVVEVLSFSKDKE